MSRQLRRRLVEKSYRIVLFVDLLEGNEVSCTDDINEEVKHMIRLYEHDLPVMAVSHSSTTPTESATGPDGKVMPSGS
jgi:hypothetical protein